MLYTNENMLYIAHKTIRENLPSFQAALEKGQTLPISSLSNTYAVDLVYEGVKFSVEVSHSGPNTYFLTMIGTHRELEAYQLPDDGLVIQVNGSSYMTYMTEKVDCYRAVIDTQTCVFEKEEYPSVLGSPSSGKLLKYLVEDGNHVLVGQPYAEIEVMKMIMALTDEETGMIYVCKRPGAVPEAGAKLARLELDDATRVNKALPYKLGFPENQDDVRQKSDKLNHQLLSAEHELENILDDFAIPEPYFSQDIENSLGVFMESFRNPELPLMELRDIISKISSRIPIQVEHSIRHLTEMYAKSMTSILARCPSNCISYW